MGFPLILVISLIRIPNKFSIKRRLFLMKSNSSLLFITSGNEVNYAGPSRKLGLDLVCSVLFILHDTLLL